MGFLDHLFDNQNKDTGQVQCPRCLGKGYVDEDDIKRLKQELKWQPGTCAYCNAKGKVDPSTINAIAADTSYLTTDLTKEERKKVMQNDPEAIQRARAYDIHIERFIEEIKRLFFSEKMDIPKIAAHILEPHKFELEKRGTYAKEKADLEKYIEKAVKRNQRNLN